MYSESNLVIDVASTQISGSSSTSPGKALPRVSNSPTNLFMSHSWDTDIRGRHTHDRVRVLKYELEKLGWKIWFDEEQLLIGCNIDVNMANGIKRSDAVCVCITKSYIEKINAQNNNCAKEWNFAQMVGKKILPLIMEEDMLDVKSWPQGIMSMYLGNTFYIDCSGDKIQENARKLSKMLELLGLTKRKIKSSVSWPLNKRLDKIPGGNGIRKTLSSKNIKSFVKI